MKCDEAKKLTAGLALDDLDAGERRDLEAHLASCADCRAAAESEARTVAALRSDDPVEGSAGRRERTVAAMVAAHREFRVQPSILMPRRRLIAASVAAAVLVALALPLLYPRGGLSVVRLDGTAWIQRSGSKDMVALQLGDKVRAGDWLRTENVVGLERRGGFKVVVNCNSRVAYDDSGPTPILQLGEGAVYVEAPGMALTIVDASGRRATVRDGTFEVRMPIVASPSGDKQTEFLIQVEKGTALITGSGGAQEVKAGSAASVDVAGRPREETPGLFAPWRKHP
jgi:hypothetical protein